MDRRIQILIVDDSTTVRQGLLALIDTAPDMTVVGQATDASTAIELTRRTQPDVIIFDPSAPLEQNINTIAALRQASGLTRILILTDDGDEQPVRAALQAGVQGYLLKDAVLTDVLTAIRRAFEGQIVLHPSLSPGYII
ncbi:MAG: response regulator transcription factor [Candidatus Promineifilaceae bacterium]